MYRKFRDEQLKKERTMLEESKRRLDKNQPLPNINERNGPTSNGTMSNGTIGNGTTSNGTMSNGTVSNGTTSNGPISNGHTSNSTSRNGPTSNGPLTNGVSGRAVVNGTAEPVVNGRVRPGSGRRGGNNPPSPRESKPPSPAPRTPTGSRPGSRRGNSRTATPTGEAPIRATEASTTGAAPPPSLTPGAASPADSPRRAAPPPAEVPQPEVPAREAAPTRVDAVEKPDDERSRSRNLEPSGPLDIRTLDLRVEENAREHHTDKYEVTEEKPYSYRGRLNQDVALVIRRGQHFDISATFNRDYSKTKDKIKIKFDPDDMKGKYTTQVEVDGKGDDGWSAEIIKDKGESVDIRVSPPADAYIAKYKVTMVTSRDGKDDYYTQKNRMFVLCNPWCKDDLVYLENDDERNEYILSDSGRLYRGSSRKIHYKKWNYGQFEDFMLDTVFYLLDESKILKDQERGNPVHLARAISSISNDSDDGGVLVGNWSGNYEDGTSPLKWSGSVAIMEKFWKTKQPVKYGQCWVFSAIVTTMCRCLGIPARSVTNFASAHDTDSSVTIDSYYIKGEDPTDQDNIWKEDSVWNFHVWNDVWMARPDLEPGYGGWQAIDGTPQEPSPDDPGKGYHVTGPMPLLALKRGNLQMPYDGKFIFAEMNADRVKWEIDLDKRTPVSVSKSSVGKFMSTKAVGNNDRQDVTDMYKFGEGTEEERATVIRAVQQGAKSKKVEEIYNQTEDVEISLVETEESDYTPLGKPFDAEIKFKNTSNEKRTVDVTLKASLVWYNGNGADVIKKLDQDVICEAGQTSTLKMTVDTDDYISKLVDMCYIKVCCMAKVKETNQIHFDDYLFMLDKPVLKVEAPTKVSLGKEYEVTVSFTNPFPYPLTDCAFTLEGPGHLKITEMGHKNIPANAEGKVTFKVASGHVGEREIIAGFDSKELSDLVGDADITIVKEDIETERPASSGTPARREVAPSEPVPAPGTTPASPGASPSAPPASAPIEVKSLDLNIQQNAERHHTEQYDLVEGNEGRDPVLVSRRGQECDVTVVFDRNYEPTSDIVTFVFDAENVSEKLTEAVVGNKFEEDAMWSVKVDQIKGNEVTFKMKSHAWCLVAKFRLDIKATVQGRGERSEFTYKQPIYVICNPWCEDDSVYMNKEDERAEYVMNDTGIIYKGSSYYPLANPWNFGQFDENILDATMYLLSNSGCMKPIERGDAIKLCRTISQMSNANDEGGVLVGKWGGGYADGTSPMAWNGSVKIIQQYFDTKQSVKYGQCWVFSAVVVTLCRAIGIPCRSVTNFDSAHDTDASMTIDSYYRPDNTEIDGGDSVWNFHVWNDVWMKRHDLEEGYDGWQAIDGTPQEASLEVGTEEGKGLMVTGPASLNALWKGYVSMKYDAKFIFAEFNADRVDWEVNGEEKKPIKVSKRSVGRAMSTKAVGSDKRADVTILYKPSEGSEEERTSVMTAVQQGSLKHEVPELYNINEDIVFDIVELERYSPLGEDLVIHLNVQNKANETRTIDVKMAASLVWYNGVTHETLKTENFEETTGAGETKQVTMTITVEEYAEKLVDMCYFRVSCIARAKETNQVYVDKFFFILVKPTLDLKVPEMVERGDMYEVKVSFKNPLPYPLTKCVFTLEGAGHMKPVSVNYDDIPARGEAELVTKIKSTKKGTKHLVVGFDSVELSDLYGEATITVK